MHNLDYLEWVGCRKLSFFDAEASQAFTLTLVLISDLQTQTASVER